MAVSNPTHALFDSSGALVGIVFPDHYAADADLRPLPANFWEVPRVWTGAGWEVDWSEVHASLHAKIDAEAGAFRRRFITTVPGQEMTYLAKEAEARALLSGGDVADAPMISGEAKVRKLAPKAMAALVVDRADEWRAMSTAIEVRRIRAKEAVVTATTRRAKEKAAAVNWDALATPDR